MAILLTCNNNRRVTKYCCRISHVPLAPPSVSSVLDLQFHG